MAWPYYDERSTYHKTIVHRVYAQLKRNGCSADFEHSLVPRRVMDTFGYNGKTKTWYLCEIKVNWPDLQKAVTQIHEQVYNFKRSKLYMDKGGNVVPVIAIPNNMYNEHVKYYTDQLESFCSLCKTTNIALWIVEQSTIRQIQGPKLKTAVKAKAMTKPKTPTKAKATTKFKTPAKAKTITKSKTPAKAKAVTKAKATTKSSSPKKSRRK